MLMLCERGTETVYGFTGFFMAPFLPANVISYGITYIPMPLLNVQVEPQLSLISQNNTTQIEMMAVLFSTMLAGRAVQTIH